jgi:hypothetical protein
MHWLGRLKQLGSRLHVFRVRTSHLHGLAAAGAMLTCAAITLNPCQFITRSKVPPGGQADGVPTPVAAVGATLTESSATSTFADGAQSAAQVDVAWQSVTAFGHLSSIPAGGIVLAAFPASSGEIDGGPPQQDAASPDSTMPQLDPEHSEVKKEAIVGIWAPDAGSCSARDFRDGFLPTVITAEGAWAGDTFCLFTRREPSETGWRVVAKCSSPRERWTSQVRLTVSENRLTWTSKRGTQAYTRCAPEVLMAQAR